jgi:hypothetical protein
VIFIEAPKAKRCALLVICGVLCGKAMPDEEFLGATVSALM